MGSITGWGGKISHAMVSGQKTEKKKKNTNHNSPKIEIYRARWFHWRILPNICRKIDMYSTQSFLENERGRNLLMHVMKLVLLIKKPDKTLPNKKELQTNIPTYNL